MSRDHEHDVGLLNWSGRHVWTAPNSELAVAAAVGSAWLRRHPNRLRNRQESIKINNVAGPAHPVGDIA